VVSIEYQLARITAQSKWADPKVIKGGVPQLTPEDVRAAVSMATSPYTYCALMSKYCQQENSEADLYQMLEVQSWLHYGERYPDRQISRAENRRLAELAVLYFLAPEVRSKGGDQSLAAYMNCHRNTWGQKFKTHFHDLTKFLFELEQQGLAEVRRTMRRNSPACA